MTSRPVVIPEAFSREESWYDWLEQFESVAEASRARMRGQAQIASVCISNYPKGPELVMQLVSRVCRRGLNQPVRSSRGIPRHWMRQYRQPWN